MGCVVVSILHYYSIFANILLSNTPPKIENAAWFSVSGDAKENLIRIHPVNLGRGKTIHTSVTYAINRAAHTFKATFVSPSNTGGLGQGLGLSYAEVVYRVYGDDKLLYTSPILRTNTSPVPVEVNVNSFNQLKMEIEIINTSDNDDISIWEKNTLGIKNAVIVTTEY